MDDGNALGGDWHPPGDQLSLPDPEPDISFDFDIRGDDQDTDVNGSQETSPDFGDFSEALADDLEERASQLLLQVDHDASADPIENDEQQTAPTAPTATMDESNYFEDPNVEESYPKDENAVPDSAHAEPANAQAGSTKRTHFVIQFPKLSDAERDEYVRVKSHTVEIVKGEDITEAGSIFYNVEFTDGRIELITHDTLISKDNGLAALERYYNLKEDMPSLKRKRPDNDEWLSDRAGGSSKDSMDHGDDDDSDDVPQRKRAARSRSARSAGIRNPPLRQKKLPSVVDTDEEDDDIMMEEAPARGRRSGRTRKPPPPALPADDKDELQEDPFEDYNDVLPLVQSDVVPTLGRPNKARRVTVRRSVGRRTKPKAIGDDIEFEAPRRSTRATKYSRDMMDDAEMDEDSFYAMEEKAPTAPKVISVREVFRPVESTSDFALKHNQTCHICKEKQRPLIYCQGCSLSFHKNCIGYRSAREHVVTKVGDGNFVLQCKFCIGLYRKRDSKAPRHSMCQGCHGKGKACAAFSEKKTSRQEEKLREENDGIDPITSVPNDLINNANLLLFRCIKCHRGWHTKHLPAIGRASARDEDPEERFKDYAVDWKCNDCTSAVKKLHRLVAWRPSNKDVAKPGLQTTHFDEDSKDYLVKWEDRSYGHCEWKPSAWIFGVAPAAMRNAFAKRDAEQSAVYLHKKDAIPEEYLMPDVILAMRWSNQAPKMDSKADELQNMTYVRKIFVKFQGLGYDDVVWDSPPARPNDDEVGDDDLSKELYARAKNIHNAMGEAFFDYTEGKHFRHESDRKIKERVRDYKASSFTEVDQQPAGLTGGKLMGYQIEGLNWLLENYHRNRSVVLADEMGLGKTVQVVSLVASLAQDEPNCWPFLVVVPNATCPNWRREFKKWTPDLRVVTYHGGRQAQELAYKYELFPDGTDDMRAHVVIMSYDSAADPQTKTLFKRIQWQGLVVDEGQRLKNDSNLLYLALKAMKIPFRLLLTGTPLQNNKRELFNLLQFIDETQDAAKLDEEFEVLDKETLPKLHEKIRPYFLRRTKAGVLKFLPPMAQIILPVTMTSLQEKLSKSIMEKNPQLIKSMFATTKLKATERGSLNNILMQLRKCLCHPFIYSDAIEERHHDQAFVHRNLVDASSKLMLLELMLPKLKERGHRVLIFSQFLNQLDIVEDFLNGMNFGFRRLDGQISSLEKQRRIDAFNAPDSELFAFLLSTRAGGVGINLATADTVIIMDPDFNPHQDIQALSRAHRIGQKNKVLCFQLVTKDSVEERIMQIGRKKMALDHALIESMDDNDVAGDDLESILKHGAQALFNDDYQKDAIVYDSASIDKIIDRTQVEKTEVTEDGSGDTQFSHARVWANEKSAFQSGLGNEEQNAPEPQLKQTVWDRIIEQRAEEARKEEEAHKEVLGRGGRRRPAAGNYNAVAPDPALEINDVASQDSSDSYSSNSGDESEEDPEAGGKDAQGQAALEAVSLRAKPEKDSRAKTLQTASNPVKSTPKSATNPAVREAIARAEADEVASGQREGQGKRDPQSKTNGTGSAAKPRPGVDPNFQINLGPGRHRPYRPHVPHFGDNFRNNVDPPGQNALVTLPRPLQPPAAAQMLRTQQPLPQQNQQFVSQVELSGLVESLRTAAQLRLALDFVARAPADLNTKEAVRLNILRKLRDVVSRV